MFTLMEVGIVLCFLISRQKYNMPISGVNSKNAVHTQLFSVLTNFPKTIYESPDRLYIGDRRVADS
jgi:hypothetical protein